MQLNTKRPITAHPSVLLPLYHTFITYMVRLNVMQRPWNIDSSENLMEQCNIKPNPKLIQQPIFAFVLG